MSWVSSAFGKVKDAAVGAGHAVGNVVNNPYAKAALAAGLAATGVGAPAAAGIMAGTGALGGALHEGGGLRDAIGGGATGAVEGYGAGKIGEALHGAGSIGTKLAGAYGAAKGAVPGLSAAESLAGGGGGFLDAAKDFLTGNGGQNALAAAQGANAAYLGKKSSDFANNAMGSVQQNWNERQPLREAGQAGMLDPEAGIAAKIAALPNHNLYAQPSLAPVASAPPALPSSPTLGPATPLPTGGGPPVVPFGPGKANPKALT